VYDKYGRMLHKSSGGGLQSGARLLRGAAPPALHGSRGDGGTHNGSAGSPRRSDQSSGAPEPPHALLLDPEEDAAFAGHSVTGGLHSARSDPGLDGGKEGYVRSKIRTAEDKMRQLQMGAQGSGGLQLSHPDQFLPHEMPSTGSTGSHLADDAEGRDAAAAAAVAQRLDPRAQEEQRALRRRLEALSGLLSEGKTTLAERAAQLTKEKLDLVGRVAVAARLLRVSLLSDQLTALQAQAPTPTRRTLAGANPNHHPNSSGANAGAGFLSSAANRASVVKAVDALVRVFVTSSLTGAGVQMPTERAAKAPAASAAAAPAPASASAKAASRPRRSGSIDSERASQRTPQRRSSVGASSRAASDVAPAPSSAAPAAAAGKEPRGRGRASSTGPAEKTTHAATATTLSTLRANAARIGTTSVARRPRVSSLPPERSAPATSSAAAAPAAASGARATPNGPKRPRSLSNGRNPTAHRAAALSTASTLSGSVGQTVAGRNGGDDAASLAPTYVTGAMMSMQSGGVNRTTNGRSLRKTPSFAAVYSPRGAGLAVSLNGRTQADAAAAVAAIYASGHTGPATAAVLASVGAVVPSASPPAPTAAHVARPRAGTLTSSQNTPSAAAAAAGASVVDGSALRNNPAFSPLPPSVQRHPLLPKGRSGTDVAARYSDLRFDLALALTPEEERELLASGADYVPVDRLGSAAAAAAASPKAPAIGAITAGILSRATPAGAQAAARVSGYANMDDMLRSSGGPGSTPSGASSGSAMSAGASPFYRTEARPLFLFDDDTGYGLKSLGKGEAGSGAAGPVASMQGLAQALTDASEQQPLQRAPDSAYALYASASPYKPRAASVERQRPAEEPKPQMRSPSAPAGSRPSAASPRSPAAFLQAPGAPTKDIILSPSSVSHMMHHPSFAGGSTSKLLAAQKMIYSISMPAAASPAAPSAAGSAPAPQATTAFTSVSSQLNLGRAVSAAELHKQASPPIPRAPSRSRLGSHGSDLDGMGAARRGSGDSLLYTDIDDAAAVSDGDDPLLHFAPAPAHTAAAPASPHGVIAPSRMPIASALGRVLSQPTLVTAVPAMQ
jgi:hypothetical protein